MAPVAVDASPDYKTATFQKTPVATKGPALAIGSLTTAQDGKYQTLITYLEQGTTSRVVEKQMVDRLIDGGSLSDYIRYVF